MAAQKSPSVTTTTAAFVELVGKRVWQTRVAELGRAAAERTRAGKALMQRHAVELTIERLRRKLDRAPNASETLIAGITAEAITAVDRLHPQGRDKLRARLTQALDGDNSLIDSFHLFRTARMQRERGFDVALAGLDDNAPFDLLISREGVDAEVACDVVSAEAGRSVHRGAWYRLADRIDPDLNTWLSAHPGRYLLKLTLPEGLRGGLRAGPNDCETLACVHERIRSMLTNQRRSDQDAAVVLRLDPLMLAAAQADELGLMSSLRREFGPEAHLSVTAGGGGVFVMAARSGQENQVAAAVRQRLAAIAPVRLTGTRPGILSIFVEDVDRAEWRGLRDRLELEGEARQFLTHPEARPVVAVACSSRMELFGICDEAAPDGEYRFRNPAHPAAKAPGLAPAVHSSM